MFLMMVKEIGIRESKCRLLVVDDDPYVAEFFEAFFESRRYELKVTNDIDEGREEVKKGDYDVIFLNVYLPGADGLDLLEEVEKVVDMGKVVVIAGDITEGLKKRMTSLGITRSLVKPFDLEEINSIVGNGHIDANRDSDQRNDRAT